MMQSAPAANKKIMLTFSNSEWYDSSITSDNIYEWVLFPHSCELSADSSQTDSADILFSFKLNWKNSSFSSRRGEKVG